MIREVRLDKRALGFVWDLDSHSAVVLYDRVVQNLAVLDHTDSGTILGIAMAHERSVISCCGPGHIPLMALCDDIGP